MPEGAVVEEEEVEDEEKEEEEEATVPLVGETTAVEPSGEANGDGFGELVETIVSAT